MEINFRFSGQKFVSSPKLPDRSCCSHNPLANKYRSSFSWVKVVGERIWQLNSM